MKKFFTKILLASFVAALVFTTVSSTKVEAQTVSISLTQFAELLISIGVVTPDKADAARAAIAALGNSNTIATSTLSYNGNGNTSGTAPSSATYVSGSVVTVSGVGSLVKTGSTFAGWNTAANGSGTNYASGSSITTGSTNVTLYAKWNSDSVTATSTLSYNGNGNTSGTVPATTTHASSTSTLVSGKGNLTKTGYNFVSWNTLANGNGTNYASSSTIVMGATNVVLYAKWASSSVATSTVSYNGNGHTSGTVPASATYASSTTVIVSGNTGNLAKTGYTFDGWNTAANGGGQKFASSSAFTMGTSNVTLYAVWTSGSVNPPDNGGGLLPPAITKCTFNATKYANYYSDLKSSIGTNESKLKEHWLTVGITEGRTPCGSDMPSCRFDALTYVSIYPDLVKASNDPYYLNNMTRIMTDAKKHYTTLGITEGRGICNITQ